MTSASSLPPPPESGPQGPSSSAGDLIASCYPALRRMAAVRAAGTGLSPSSLANDAVCRLLKLPVPPANEPALQAMAYQLLEWLLIDKLRKAASVRNLEGVQQVGSGSAEPASGVMVATLSHLLEPLAAMDARKAEVVVLWAVGKLTMKQIATALCVSEKTVQRDLEFARAWLGAAANRGAS